MYVYKKVIPGRITFIPTWNKFSTITKKLFLVDNIYSELE